MTVHNTIGNKQRTIDQTPKDEEIEIYAGSRFPRSVYMRVNRTKGAYNIHMHFHRRKGTYILEN